MTSKIINIFNNKPVETEEDNSVKETIDELITDKDTIKELIVIAVTFDDEMLVRSSNISRETAYYLLGLAKLEALTN